METETTTPSGTADAAAETPHKEHGSHRILVPILAVVGLICIFLSTVSIWLRDAALDSNNWANESGQLLQRPAVRSLVSSYVADAAITQTDAESALRNALPPRLQPLAAPGTAALGRLAVQGVDQALLLPRVQALWVEANKRAHERLVAFLKGDTSRLQNDNGNVVLNLDTIIGQVATNLGASPGAVQQVQSHVQPIVLVHSDQLGYAQAAVQAVDFLSIWPFLLGVILLLAAIYLARGRRRRTVRGISVGFIFMGILLLVGSNVAGNFVTDSLVSVDSVRPAVQDVWSIYTNLLHESAVAGIAVGILGLIWAWLAGPTGLATRIRALFAPVFRQHVLGCHATLAMVLLLVIYWSPVGTPRRTGGVILVAVLAFVGLEAIRRQSVQENPEATGTLGSALHGLVSRARDRSHPAAAADDRVARLERLATLRERGALTDGEYEKEKALVLSS